MRPVVVPLFACTITLQFVVIVVHDLLHIPGWTHGRQIRAALGPRKFWGATLINAVFPGVAFALAVRFHGSAVPAYAAGYWTLYCAVTVASAIAMWWLPYFFGTDEKTRRLYAAMYAGTRQLLPPRGDNPRPNTLHLGFHALFALNLLLALGVQFGRR
jgi:hypothetical protein